jgi:hypothetical protein
MVRVHNRKSLNLVLDYFSKFKLYSSKYLDYKNWAVVARLLLSNTAYTTENKNKIYDLKNSMNNKRIIFNWDHLNDL